MWLIAREAFLEDLFVVAQARRGGVGRKLLELAIARSKERGCREINLDTNESNEVAIRLYDRLGFVSGSGSAGGRPIWLERPL